MCGCSFVVILIAFHDQQAKNQVCRITRIQTGVEFMDAIGLVNADESAKAIAAATAEVRVVCGHIHSLAINGVGGQVAISAPSTCSSFELDLRAGAPVGFYDRPDGCLLHRWSSGFSTHVIGARTGAGPFPV